MTNKYVLGQVVFLRARLSDPATGNVNDPTTQDPVDDASLVMTVYKPDLTTATPALTHVTLGIYTAQVTVDQAGPWTYVSTSTGAAAGAARERFWVDGLP